MDLAIIETGGKQYKVKPGQELEIELISGKKENDSLEFADLLSRKKVLAKVIKQVKGPKIHIFKFKNKTRYRRKIGHRQNYLRIKIEEIK
jgi:large subunit ribosomal protein L21